MSTKCTKWAHYTLGPVDPHEIDWVIAGAESGSGARPSTASAGRRCPACKNKKSLVAHLGISVIIDI